MKALILNSGMGSRMGALTAEQPKCLTKISGQETILSRQLKQLSAVGIKEVVITTGAHAAVLESYCQSLELPVEISFVHNPLYRETNYIYSLYLARELVQDEDIILLHGDLVFEHEVLQRTVDQVAGGKSCMAVSSSQLLPEKDFKAVVENGSIRAVGIEFFANAMAAQPLYGLCRQAWQAWQEEIAAFCEAGDRGGYAENALNRILDRLSLMPLDVRNLLCGEIDNPADLEVVSGRLAELARRNVYMCFSTDILHSGHIALIRRAQQYGRLIIGVLSDEAVASYKRFPLLPQAERMALFANVAGVYKVVEQQSLSYRDNLERYRPDVVVHGDDWQNGLQKPVRDEVVSVLASYGGRLVEFPYAGDRKYQEIEGRTKAELGMADRRRPRLKKLLDIKGLVTAIETHSGLTGLLAEKMAVGEKGGVHQFDAMWVSSLCDSTAKGKPDIELVDMSSRFQTINDIMEVTTKPIIFDGDTGGLKEHFVYTVRTLERMGVSMVIIEDKKGLKKNSLFGTEVKQTQDSIENFCEKIRAGKQAQKTDSFMICARIESLILEQGMEDALARARAFTEAGADAIMIHSRRKEPDEIFEFVERFRQGDAATPLVVVPTSFNHVREEEFAARGVNVIIYANQITRAAVPAMQEAARRILSNHRSLECDDICMPFKEIIRLIPADY